MNFNLTRSDLATKSASQLAALFQQASNAIKANQAKSASAQSLLAMIRSEMANRTPSP